MLRAITADQLDEWIAYYRLEPFGVEMWDWLIAHFKALFANANRDPKKKGKGYSPGQLLCFPVRKGKAVQNIGGEELLNDEEEDIQDDQRESDDCQPENEPEE